MIINQTTGEAFKEEYTQADKDHASTLTWDDVVYHPRRGRGIITDLCKVMMWVNVRFRSGEIVTCCPTVLTRHSDNRTCDLYRFYDANGTLLYVGISYNAAARAGQHSKDKWWWSNVVRMDVEHLPDRDVAAQAERHAIQTEHPRYNVVHRNERADAVQHERECKQRGREACEGIRPRDVVIHVPSGMPGVVLEIDDRNGKLDVLKFDNQFAYRYSYEFDRTGLHARTPLTDADKHAICDELGIPA